MRANVRNGGGQVPAKGSHRGEDARGNGSNGAGASSGAAAAEDSIAEQMSQVALESGISATLAMVRDIELIAPKRRRGRWPCQARP